MAINKKALKDRIDKMFWLEKDWDGFDTLPICKNVYDISKQLIDLIDENYTFEIKVFIGVIVEESLYLEAYRDNICRLEMTINPDGTIDCIEIRDGTIVSTNSFVLDPETINNIFADIK